MSERQYPCILLSNIIVDRVSSDICLFVCLSATSLSVFNIADTCNRLDPDWQYTDQQQFFDDVYHRSVHVAKQHALNLGIPFYDEVTK